MAVFPASGRTFVSVISSCAWGGSWRLRSIALHSLLQIRDGTEQIVFDPKRESMCSTAVCTISMYVPYTSFVRHSPCDICTESASLLYLLSRAPLIFSRRCNGYKFTEMRHVCVCVVPQRPGAFVAAAVRHCCSCICTTISLHAQAHMIMLLACVDPCTHQAVWAVSCIYHTPSVEFVVGYKGAKICLFAAHRALAVASM